MAKTKKAPAPMRANINPRLHQLAVPLTKLKEDPENARQHDDRNLGAIQQSLITFGQQKPIVILEDGTIAAGNGTFRAARALGWDVLAAVVFEGSLEQARAYAIADNRTGELSTWDDARLAEQFEKLHKLWDDWSPEMVGFSDDEVLKIVGEHFGADVVEEEPAPPPVPHSGTHVAAEDGDDSDDLDSGPPAAVPVSAAAQAGIEASHVRMVQLFLNQETHPPFMEQIKRLAERYGTPTVTDTVLRAVAEVAGPAPDKAE
jgi:hypothetical protein